MDLENLLIKEYANEGMVIEATMSSMESRDEMTRELGSRTMKLSTIAFLEEAKENAAIQVQLADLLVDVLENECIRHNMIKKAPVGLSVVISLVKDTE